jgi:hypothetical protein
MTVQGNRLYQRVGSCIVGRLWGRGLAGLPRCLDAHSKGENLQASTFVHTFTRLAPLWHAVPFGVLAAVNRRACPINFRWVTWPNIQTKFRLAPCWDAGRDRKCDGRGERCTILRLWAGRENDMERDTPRNSLGLTHGTC